MQITRTRGDTYADRFYISQSRTGMDVNLSGCSFKMTVGSKRTPGSSDLPAYQVTGVIKDPALGIVEFAPTAMQADLVGDFFYDIQMTDSAGAIRTLVLDTYTYVQDITK